MDNLIPIEHVFDMLMPGVDVYRHGKLLGYIGVAVQSKESIEALLTEYEAEISYDPDGTEVMTYLSYALKFSDSNIGDYFVDAEQFCETLGGDYGSGLTFGQSLILAQRGYAIQRSGWNGKGMFVAYMPALYLPPFNTQDTSRKVNDRTAKWIGEGAPLDCQPYFAMYTASKQWQPGWVASQQDMFARDWLVFKP